MSRKRLIIPILSIILTAGAMYVTWYYPFLQIKAALPMVLTVVAINIIGLTISRKI